MKRTLRLVIAGLLLSAFLVTSVLTASAYAIADEVALSCSSFSASGTSDQPYVTIYAYNYDTTLEYFVIVPVTGGSFSGSVSFPEAPEGTVFDVEVWGTLALYVNLGDLGYWDGDFTYYHEDVACTAAAAAARCPYPLPADSAVYDVPLGAPAFFAADLQSATGFDLPAGTWKISEFDNDFAKVWIACDASPIWIPSNSVGEIVG